MVVSTNTLQLIKVNFFFVAFVLDRTRLPSETKLFCSILVRGVLVSCGVFRRPVSLQRERVGKLFDTQLALPSCIEGNLL